MKITPKHLYQRSLQLINLVRIRKRTLGWTAKAMADLHGENVFVLFENEDISFAEFNRRANRRAHYFSAQGLKKGDVMALVMENRPEFIETLTGLNKLGVVTATINTNLKEEQLAHCVNLSEAKGLIVGAECLENVHSALAQMTRIPPEKIYVDTRWEAPVAPPAGAVDLSTQIAGADSQEPPDIRAGMKDLLMYIYTSGTTGLPKAANITNGRFYGVGQSQKLVQALTPSDTIYACLPLYHSNAFLIGFGGAIVNGTRFALARKFSVSRFWDDIHKFNATSFIYIGELLRYLTNAEPSPKDQGHQVTRIFGNGLRADYWKAFQARFKIPVILEFYASTEGNMSIVNTENKVGSVGKPSSLRPNNLYLVRYDVDTDEYARDKNGLLIPCEVGEVGELLGEITFFTPFSGYTNAEASQKKLVKNVKRKGDVFFRTGDLLKTDADGYYYFIDRIGDTFRWKGENVSTEEVQKVVGQFNGIHLVNVYGVKVPDADGRAGMAALTMKNGNTFEPKTFFDFISERLPVYARPAFVRLTPEQDMTGTFKMKKTDLQAQGYDPEASGESIYYRDDSEKTYLPVSPQVKKQIDQGEIRL